MPADNIDRNLASLAEAAVATLANEMHTARNSKDRQAAANSILDRIGFGRATRVQADVADSEIRNALEAASGVAASLSRTADEIAAGTTTGANSDQDRNNHSDRPTLALVEDKREDADDDTTEGKNRGDGD